MLRPLLVLLLTLAPSTAIPRDDALSSRELAGISEEQALLSRQLSRLRQTMEVLVLRLEAEGRPRAVELLKEGLELLNDRPESAQSLTLEESMADARERMQNGQVVQSLERQTMVIQGLEQLLSVLMERGNLDNIEEKLDRIREIKEGISELSQRERDLQRETEELREDSTSADQRTQRGRRRSASSASARAPIKSPTSSALIAGNQADSLVSSPMRSSGIPRPAPRNAALRKVADARS